MKQSLLLCLRLTCLHRIASWIDDKECELPGDFRCISSEWERGRGDKKVNKKIPSYNF